MKISIVIPTLNEEEYLPKLLDSIKRQTFKDYEVIVADAGSKDKTREIALKYGAKVAKGGMPGPGRNAGAKVAKGDFLFFFDADVKLSNDFLQKAYDEMQDRYIDLATCEIRPLSNFALDKVMHDFANTSIKLSQFKDPHTPGSCTFITRRLFERIGGYDETLKLAEDHDLGNRATKFRPLRVLNNAYVQISVRRLRKEGRFVLIGKYAKAEIYRFLQGGLRDDVVEYEFANFDKKRNKPLDKKLLKLEKNIYKINQRYNKLKKNMKEGRFKKSSLDKINYGFNKTSESFRKIMSQFKRKKK